MKSVLKSRIGHYKILSQIGAGGMGKVYLAEDTRLERKVALKLLNEEYTKSEDRMRRFVQEAKTASSLNHPNIIVIHEIGESGGIKFIAAEYIEGETLRERLLRSPLTLEEVLGIVVQIAEALTVAHKAKIIHRDIKPENIMIRPDGYIKVLDFGLAKLAEQEKQTFGSEIPTQKLVKTNPGVVMGSAAYMSPEQARGLADIDERTDIFSLGIVLYEMLSGRLPFSGATLSEVIASVIYKDAESVARYYKNCPPELERIVMKSLEKDREQRYQVIKDLALDLKSFKRRLEFEAELGRKGISKKETVLDQPSKRFSPPTVSTSSGGNKDAILLTEFENLTGDPVFDNTLKMALAVALEQSPFLNIFGDERVRQILPLMGRSTNERITKEIAKEICQRKGLKAFITGTISNLGTMYILTLEADNAHTGEVFARQFEQAESKEQVLKALVQAASGLREKLGESLSSIEQFDAPLELTTSSLEALKVHFLGFQLTQNGKFVEAIPFFKRAIELDENFASAYAGLATLYHNIGQPKLAREYEIKAFDLRNRGSEVEKLRITSHYYSQVTGEVDRAIESLEWYNRTHPPTLYVVASLAACYYKIGEFEKAAANLRECIKLAPNSVFGYSLLAEVSICSGNLSEAKEILKEAFEKKIDLNYFHVGLYLVAFLENDKTLMTEHLTWFSGRPDEYIALEMQTGTAAFQGEWRKSKEFSRRAIDLALKSEASEAAAQFAAEQALRVVFWSSGAGFPEPNNYQLERALKAQIQKALSLERNKSTLAHSALALAAAGQKIEANKLFEELKSEYPKDTLVNQLWMSTIKAAINLHEDKAEDAIKDLERAGRYERVAAFYPQYLRGLAYLKLKKENESIKEFEKILNRRGESPLSAIYPLAQLGKARATKNKEDYEKFFEIWREADKDMPALVAARKEFEELNKTK